MRIIVSPLVLLKNYMKPILLFTGSLLIVSIASSQNVGINTDGSAPSMLLHLKIPSGDDGIRVQNASGSGDGFLTFKTEQLMSGQLALTIAMRINSNSPIVELWEQTIK